MISPQKSFASSSNGIIVPPNVCVIALVQFHILDFQVKRPLFGDGRHQLHCPPPCLPPHNHRQEYFYNENSVA